MATAVQTPVVQTTTAQPTAVKPTPPPKPEQFVILNNVSWDTYIRLITEHGESGGTRFTFDQGVLQIMVVSLRHENANRILATLVDTIVEEMGLDIVPSGSLTLKRPDLEKGFEPDTSFYIQHADDVRGKSEIVLPFDPPPDLHIEIDITSGSLNRLPIFAAVGVPEVWRYDQQSVIFHRLQGADYTEVEYSLAFPILSSQMATQFLFDSQTMKRLPWLRHVRGWIRQQLAAQQGHSE